MQVAAKLALFTGALVLAVVAGWGAGLVVGPVPFGPFSSLPGSAPPASGAPTHPTTPDHLEHP